MPCWWCAHRRKGHPLSGQPQHCTAWPSASDLPLPAPGPVAAVLPLGAHPPCRRPPAAACSPGPGRGTRQRPAERGAAGWAYRLQARRRGPAQAAPRCKARCRRPTRSSGGGGCTPTAHLQVPHDARVGGKGGDRGDERGGGDGRNLVHRLLGVALCFARRTLLLQLLRRRLLRAAGPARNDWAAGAARGQQPTLSRVGLGGGRPRSHTALLHLRADLPIAALPQPYSLKHRRAPREVPTCPTLSPAVQLPLRPSDPLSSCPPAQVAARTSCVALALATCRFRIGPRRRSAGLGANWQGTRAARLRRLLRVASAGALHPLAAAPCIMTLLLEGAGFQKRECLAAATALRIGCR